MKFLTKTRVMIYGSLFVILFLLSVFVKNPVFGLVKPVDGVVKANPERLKSVVSFLVSLNPPRNFEHHESLDRAADFISMQFRDAGLRPSFQDYKYLGKTYRNVFVRLGPTSGEALVIGAHYDVCEDLPGADDNASGVAGLLELARVLAPMNSRLRRPIELVAFTLEEPPNFGGELMGSYIHAQSLSRAGVKIKLMISLEMIGYFSDEAWSQKYPMPAFYLLYPMTGDYIALLARPAEWGVMREVKSLFMGATDLPTRTANVPQFVPGVSLSDHYNYWDFGFPAMMITDTAFMRNFEYHKKSDTPDRLNYVKMTEVVNGVAAVALGL